MVDEERKQFTKRGASVPVTIKNISSDHVRVSITGTIVSKNDSIYSFMVDDGTGTIVVITNDIDRFKELREGQFVRVLGRTWGEADETELQADIIQDFSKIDKELWKKVYI